MVYYTLQYYLYYTHACSIKCITSLQYMYIYYHAHVHAQYTCTVHMHMHTCIAHMHSTERTSGKR